jgi:hypothetical protein
MHIFFHNISLDKTKGPEGPNVWFVRCLEKLDALDRQCNREIRTGELDYQLAALVTHDRTGYQVGRVNVEVTANNL